MPVAAFRLSTSLCEQKCSKRVRAESVILFIADGAPCFGAKPLGFIVAVHSAWKWAAAE